MLNIGKQRKTLKSDMKLKDDSHLKMSKKERVGFS